MNAYNNGGKYSYRYAGHEYMNEKTGLQYMQARWMMPNIGRFISGDPAKDGLNWYVYGANNPTTLVDPDGLTSTGPAFVKAMPDWYVQYFVQYSGLTHLGNAVYAENALKRQEKRNKEAVEQIQKPEKTIFDFMDIDEYQFVITFSKDIPYVELSSVGNEVNNSDNFSPNQEKIAGHPFTEKTLTKLFLKAKYNHVMEYDNIDREIQMNRMLRMKILLKLFQKMKGDSYDLGQLSNENPIALKAINAAMGGKAHYGYSKEHTLDLLDNMIRTPLGIEGTNNLLTRSDILGLIYKDNLREVNANKTAFGRYMYKMGALGTSTDYDTMVMGSCIALAGYIQYQAYINQQVMMQQLNNSGTKIGDFTNIKNSSIQEILNRIPKNATKRILKPIKGRVELGFEYKWVQDNITWRVRIHGPDPGAPIGSNSHNNWVVRIRRGSMYMDSSGIFHPRGITNINSPYYSEFLANDTHIPIKK